jgi:hypothetical protein
MKRTYKFTLANKDVAYVAARGRQAACMKLTGFRVAAAMELKQILSVELCKDAKKEVSAQ